MVNLVLAIVACHMGLMSGIRLWEKAADSFQLVPVVPVWHFWHSLGCCMLSFHTLCDYLVM